MNNFEERIKRIIAEDIIRTENEIKCSDNLEDDLCMDSLDKVEFAMALEEEFCMELPDEDGEKLKTVQDVIDYVEKVKK